MSVRLVLLLPVLDRPRRLGYMFGPMNGADPIPRFRRWFRAARAAGEPRADAFNLATVGRDGRPSARMVLLKRVDPDGFVFYSNAGSRKGRDMAVNPHVAATFHWFLSGRQVRIEGRVGRLSDADADAYWDSRPRGSQISAAVSQQSRPIGARRELVARGRQLARRHRDGPVPRPADWVGFRIAPRRIEFWTHRDDRLHHRELFVLRAGRWSTRLLQP